MFTYMNKVCMRILFSLSTAFIVNITIYVGLEYDIFIANTVDLHYIKFKFKNDPCKIWIFALGDINLGNRINFMHGFMGEIYFTSYMLYKWLIFMLNIPYKKFMGFRKSFLLDYECGLDDFIYKYKIWFQMKSF